MKGFIILMSYFLILTSSVGLAMAVDSTPSGTGTTSGQTNTKAKEILNKVSDQVAAMSAKQRQVYEGKIKSLGASSLMVTTVDAGDKSVATNEVTTYFRIRAGNRSSINFSGLKVGDDIAAVGPIDPATGEMAAKQIIAKIQRQNLVGGVESLDKGVAVITDSAGTKTKVDLGSANTLEKVDLRGKIVDSKLADFQTGNTVFVMAYTADSSGTLSVLKALAL